MNDFLRSMNDFLRTSNDHEVYTNQVLEVKIDLNIISNKYKICDFDKSRLKLFPLGLKLCDDCVEYINQKESIKEIEKCLERYYNEGYLVCDIILQRLPTYGYISKYFVVNGVFDKDKEMRHKYLNKILKELDKYE